MEESYFAAHAFIRVLFALTQKVPKKSRQNYASQFCPGTPNVEDSGRTSRCVLMENAAGAVFFAEQHYVCQAFSAGEKEGAGPSLITCSYTLQC